MASACHAAPRAWLANLILACGGSLLEWCALHRKSPHTIPKGKIFGTIPREERTFMVCYCLASSAAYHPGTPGVIANIALRGVEQTKCHPDPHEQVPRIASYACIIGPSSIRAASSSVRADRRSFSLAKELLGRIGMPLKV